MKKKILPGAVITLLTFVLMFSVFALPASAATSIKNAVVTYTTAYTYTGKTIKPAVTVKVGKKKLTANKHYTVAYKDNKNVGRATITVTGKGSYSGKLTKYFYIKPQKTASLKATAYPAQVKLTWSKVTGATGYQVYQHINGKWTKLSNTAKTTYTVTGLDSAVTYKFAVRAYAKAVNKYVYSAFVFKNAVTTLAKPSSLKLSAVKETSALLSWKAIAGATSYEIILCDEATGREKLFTSKTNSLEIKSLKAFSDYTVKVRAYNEGKKIYSAYSTYLTFKTAPTVVQNFKAQTASSSSIKFTWTKKDDVTGYQLFMSECDSEGNAVKYTKLGNITGTTYTVKNLIPYKQYCFRLRAYDKASQGYVYSDYTELKNIHSELTAVENFNSDTVTNNSINLTWNLMNEATGYKLYMNDELLANLDRAQAQYTAANLSSNTVYNFHITAYCLGQDGKIYESEKALLSNIRTDDNKVDSVEITSKPTSMGIGESFSLEVKVLPGYAANKAVTYTSSNTSVATVDSKGTITALASGKTDITVKTQDGGKSTSFTLTVRNVVSTAINVPSVLNVNVGETAIINPTFTPSNTTNKAFTVYGSDYSYSYTTGIWPFQSTKTETCKLADYISIGSNGMIRGLKATVEPQTNKAFTFTLTVRAADSGKTDTIKVSVTKKMISVTYNGDDSPWYYGNSVKLTATIDSSISSKYTLADLRWKSSDTSVATVSSDGTVKCMGRGDATITAYTSDGSYSGSFKVYCRSVVEIEKNYFENCKAGGSYQIKATLRPGGDTEKIKYASTDSSVAEVDSNGLVTFKKAGSVNIIVMTNMDTVNTKEVWLTSGSFTKPTGTKQQLFTVLKKNADSVKTSDNLPGFNRSDSTVFTNFTLEENSGNLNGAVTADDLYGMFGDLAAPRSFVQSPVYAGSGTTEAWQNYMLNVPVRGQYMTILEGLDMSDVKSVEVVDTGSYTYDLVLALEDESFAVLPSSATASAHGKVFDILTNSYLSSAISAINNGDAGVKITYGAFTQRYHDSSLTVSVNKITGKVSDMKYDMNIDIRISDLKMTYTLFTYTANIGFTCNNVVKFDFFGYKD